MGPRGSRLFEVTAFRETRSVADEAALVAARPPDAALDQELAALQAELADVAGARAEALVAEVRAAPSQRLPDPISSIFRRVALSSWPLPTPSATGGFAFSILRTSCS